MLNSIATPFNLKINRVVYILINISIGVEI